MKIKYYCKEKNCNKEISESSAIYGKGRCQSCANRITGFIDGRTLRKYFCKEKDCNNEICYTNFKYGSGKCRPCSKKGVPSKKSFRNILTEVFLRREYITNRKSSIQIAKELNYSKSVILTYLKKYNIKRRTSRQTNKSRDLVTKYTKKLTKEFLEYNYLICKKTAGSIALEVGCNKKTILNYLKIFGIKRRRPGDVIKGMFVGEKHWNWQGGISRLPYPFEFNDELKQRIKSRDNYICKKCGITEEEHLIVYGIRLCVHHIDYNKNNCDKDNLITLCNECNIRVNFNRDYWSTHFNNYILSIAMEK